MRQARVKGQDKAQVKAQLHGLWSTAWFGRIHRRRAFPAFGDIGVWYHTLEKSHPPRKPAHLWTGDRQPEEKTRALRSGSGNPDQIGYLRSLLGYFLGLSEAYNVSREENASGPENISRGADSIRTDNAHN
jgi:hypothetical protein